MISYFKLWRLLEKRGYQRKDIVRLAGISESTYRKLLASEAVRMDVLQRVCIALNVGQSQNLCKQQRSSAKS